MALKDYEELDEDDYYGQPFDVEGMVSIWLGFTIDEDDPENLDVLQDLCGVGYYNNDKQDMNSFDFEFSHLSELFKDISYSSSFINNVTETAKERGIEKARWVLAQYDFQYDPQKVKRKIEDDPIFLGAFPYNKQ